MRVLLSTIGSRGDVQPLVALAGRRPHVVALARSRGKAVFQTGAWILPDERPLSPELEAFLAAGEPPVYFGEGPLAASRDRASISSRGERDGVGRAPHSRSKGMGRVSVLERRSLCLEALSGFGFSNRARRTGRSARDLIGWPKRELTRGLYRESPSAIP